MEQNKEIENKIKNYVDLFSTSDIGHMAIAYAILRLANVIENVAKDQKKI